MFGVGLPPPIGTVPLLCSRMFALLGFEPHYSTSAARS
jgi:hypothetical protein